MRYDQIINEANYKNKFDLNIRYQTEHDFNKAITKFGPGKLKASKPQAGGLIYLLDDKLGVVGCKAPNPASSSGFDWIPAIEPFMPSKKTPKAVVTEPSIPAKAEAPALPPSPKKEFAPTSKVKLATPDDMTDALNLVKSYMKSAEGRNVYGTDWRGITKDDQDNKGGYSFEVRYWGVWDNPPDAHDEEDYDWQELDSAWHKKLEEILNKIAPQFPSVKLSYSTEEKNYIVIFAKSKV